MLRGKRITVTDRKTEVTRLELYDRVKKELFASGAYRYLLVGTVCAFSGGADSAVMLRILQRLSKELDFPLYAAHLNHMIRGDEADRDAGFCADTAKELGVEFLIGNADIPEECARTGEGLEECARRKRYEFLYSVCRDKGASALATAHNATDNLETVIFNLSRGAGAAGLSGISPFRPGKSGDPALVRPLLSLTGEEIREYAKTNGIAYVTDSTNGDDGYTRNYIRHTIVPSLRTLNGNVDSAVLKMSGRLRLDNAYINDAAREIIHNGKIYRNDARSAPDPVLARAVAILYSSVKGNADGLSEPHIDQCRRLCRGTEPGMIALPASLAFFADSDCVWVAESHTFFEKDGGSDKIFVSPGESLSFGPFELGFQLCSSEDFKSRLPDRRSKENIYNLSINSVLDFDKINSDLYLRARKAGDEYSLRGVKRKLKKLMCDCKVPVRYRDKLPLLCAGEQILLVTGLPCADIAAPDGGAKKLLVVSARLADTQKN